MFTAIAAICAAALPSFAETLAVTNTVNGIAWQLLIDTSNNTVSVGPIWGNPADSTEWVAFKATTQTQLDAVLGACSASSKVLVDPSGATERLEVPAGRHIAMLMSPDGVVKPEERGFMMVVR